MCRLEVDRKWENYLELCVVDVLTPLCFASCIVRWMLNVFFLLEFLVIPSQNSNSVLVSYAHLNVNVYSLFTISLYHLPSSELIKKGLFASVARPLLSIHFVADVSGLAWSGCRCWRRMMMRPPIHFLDSGLMRIVNPIPPPMMMRLSWRSWSSRLHFCGMYFLFWRRIHFNLLLYAFSFLFYLTIQLKNCS